MSRIHLKSAKSASAKGRPAGPRPNVYNALCPSRDLLSRVGDKWSALLIGALAGGTLRFGELMRRADGVSQKMLTQTLRNLERDGLVKRKLFAEVPPRVEYSLSPLGASLAPILDQLMQWSEQHWKKVESAHAAHDAREVRS